jgi:WD40 repeat protein
MKLKILVALSSFGISIAVLPKAEAAQTAQSLAISSSGTSIDTQDGTSWLSLSQIPKEISGVPKGIELARERFTQVAMSPDLSHLAVVIDGHHHAWVLIVRHSDKSQIIGHILYGGSASNLLWSPDSKKLLVCANEATGLPGLTVLFMPPSKPPLRVSTLVNQSVSQPISLSSPKWSPDGNLLTFSASGGATNQVKMFELSPESGTIFERKFN